jgi:dihydrofolate reductase
MIVSMLVAADEKNSIGLHNKLPWHLPADLKYFKRLTLDHHILMGRKTFESIGKPLKERVNIVLTTDKNYVLTTDKNYVQPGAVTVNSLEEGIAFAQQAGEGELFVIGGAGVFNDAVRVAHRLYLTRIHYAFDADVFLPFVMEPTWKLVSSESHQPDEKNLWPYTFELYELRPLPSAASR